MKSLSSWSRLTLGLLAIMTSASAASFDGAQPLICEALQGHDCTALQPSCKRLEKPVDADEQLVIDVAQKIVRSPYRTEPLPIERIANNARSLLLQGSTADIIWNAAVRQNNGALTITIADREGAYVVFGKCRIGAKPS